MRPRIRKRRIAKWVGLALCLFVLIVWYITVQWRWFSYGGESWGIGVAGGFAQALTIGNVSYKKTTGWESYKAFDPTPYVPQERGFQKMARRWHLRPPSFHRATNGGMTLTIPLWIPFLMTSLATTVFWFMDRRRDQANHCRICGYNLTGNESGICSECGTKIGAAIVCANGK